MSRKDNDKFSAEETQRRFEAALRGARITGHKDKEEVSRDLKRAKRSAKKRR